MIVGGLRDMSPQDDTCANDDGINGFRSNTEDCPKVSGPPC